MKRYALFVVLLVLAFGVAQAQNAFSHDVGVTDLALDPPPQDPPDNYAPGTEITFTATVENFGTNAEYDIPVRCQVWEMGTDPDSLRWHCIHAIEFLDWSGNEEGNPYTTEVVFPTFPIPFFEWLMIVCRTEMEGDENPENDEVIRYINYAGAVEESGDLPVHFYFDVAGSGRGECTVRFEVPGSRWIKLDIYDVNGRRIRTLTNDIYQPGSYEFVWNGQDACGRKVAAGVYLVRMEADEFKAVRKVVIIN